MGLLFAFTAIVSWGLGDFLIQKNARKFGDWIALFFVTIIGSILFLPFVWNDIPALLSNSNNLLFLLGTSVVLLIAGLMDFEALRRGKISVIEPIYAFEVPVTVGLSTFLLHEHMTSAQTIMVILLMIGIVLISTKTFSHFKNLHAERGAFMAIGATTGMGIINFLFGIGARAISPLVVNWFTSVFLAIVCFVYIVSTKKYQHLAHDWRRNRKLISVTGIFDNLAWIAYAYAAIYMPIAIATSLTESYIALAAMLGLIYNKERLRTHQYAGLVLCVIAAIILAFITG